MDDDKIPSELLNFKVLINPIRMAIMSLLFKYYRLPSSEVRKILGLSWGNFNSHLKMLIKNSYISSRREISVNMPMIYLYLEPEGDRQYKSFKQIWDKLSK